MKAKKVLLLGILCIFLGGCKNGNLLEMKDPETSIEKQETQREEPESEEGKRSLTEGRDIQREETKSEESKSNPTQGAGDLGARFEGCYDDPNNPVKDQNYNVGQPIYE